MRAFTEDDLRHAAGLLADRHAAHRIAAPLLPDIDVAPLLAAEWGQPGASGAVSGGGYLIGYPKGESWGPNVWVENAGHAARDPELIGDLYGFAAERWVAEGRVAHYVLVPSHDTAAVDAWFRLGFGLQHVHAVRPTSAYPGRPVRRAVRADVPRLVELELLLPVHQAGSPTFSPVVPDSPEELEADCLQEYADDETACFVAELDGEVVGKGLGVPVELSAAHAGLARPENAGFLAQVTVLPAARGRGVARALGEAVIDWAYSAGKPSIVVDWRSTNLLSSRTWPRLGFATTWYRLHRYVAY